MPPYPTGKSETPAQQYQHARDAAFRLLRYRARSEAEVRNRLGRRYGPEVIDQVITSLHDQGFLDDAAFASQWRDHRERRSPRGRGLLRQELLRLGVSPEVVREALADFDAEDNAYRAGRGLAVRLADGEKSQFRQRLWAHLQRRGFDSGVIGEAVQRLWEELADPLDGHVDADANEE